MLYNIVQLSFRIAVNVTWGFPLFLQRRRTNNSNGRSMLQKHTWQRSRNELQAKNKIGNN